MEWLNRMGLIIQFLSFWLAAPEILGEERLRRLQSRIASGVNLLPSLSVEVTMGGLAVIAVMLGIWLDTILSPILPEPNSAVRWSGLPSRPYLLVMVVIAFTALNLAAFWVGRKVSAEVKEKIVPRLLDSLAKNERVRQRSLVLGAALFTAGFLMQLVATF